MPVAHLCFWFHLNLFTGVSTPFLAIHSKYLLHLLLSFAGLRAFVATIQLSHCKNSAATDNIKMDGYSCALIKHLPKNEQEARFCDATKLAAILKYIVALIETILNRLVSFLIHDANEGNITSYDECQKCTK